jgi:acyl-coenzyme A synthetase/AMP-(fatty) acid ligase
LYGLFEDHLGVLFRLGEVFEVVERPLHRFGLDGAVNVLGVVEVQFGDAVVLAVVDENGMVSIQDRKTDIIVSGGENISSIELEDTLFDHPDVANAAVIPSPSEEWGETPKALVIPANGDPANPDVTEDDLVEFTDEELASYKALQRVEFVEDLPETATGKV